MILIKREFLSVEESCLEQPGQLLEKASAKQSAEGEAKPFSLEVPIKKNVSVIGRSSIPDAEAGKKDDMPMKVAPAMLDGHNKPSVHTVGGVLLGVSLDNKRSEVDVQF